MRRNLIGLASVLAASAAAVALWQVQPNVAQANRGDAPKYSVDPSWPKHSRKWPVEQVPGLAD